jgi:hypothetical protein
MKVVFDGTVATYHPATGLDLSPGENEVADDKGEQLLAAGLVRKPSEGKRARKAEE